MGIEPEIPIANESDQSITIKDITYYNKKIESKHLSFFQIFDKYLINLKLKTCNESDLPLNLSSLKFSKNIEDSIITLLTVDDFNKFSLFIEKIYNNNQIYGKILLFTKNKLRLKRKHLRNIVFYLKKYLSSLATKITLQEDDIKHYGINPNPDDPNCEEQYKKLSFLTECFKTIQLNLEIISSLLNEADCQLNDNKQKEKEQFVNKLLHIETPKINLKNKIGSLLIGLSLIKKYEKNADIYAEQGKIWCGEHNVFSLMDDKEKEIMSRNDWIIDQNNDNRLCFTVE